MGQKVIQDKPTINLYLLSTGPGDKGGEHSHFCDYTENFFPN